MDTTLPLGDTTSHYWLDITARKAIERFGQQEIIVSTGHSPSGAYHVGHLREFLTASAVVWAIKAQGGNAKHLDFVDDFDAFRKVPVDVPASYEEFLGMPLYMVPDPFSCHTCYADHYYAGLQSALERVGVTAQTVHARDSYPSGKFTQSIEQTLAKLPEVKQIIQTVGRRELPSDWAPVQLLDDNNRLNNWKFTGWNADDGTISWRDNEGQTGTVPYGQGRVKLDWRLDWPARWQLFGIGVEPFGRDHASKGGSYETGSELVRHIFNAEPPMPVPYDFINLVGDTKKMSASKGTGLSMGEALDLLPPEILRYFVVRSRPAKLLQFDPGLGLSQLIDEYAATDQSVRSGEPAEFGEAYQFAAAIGEGRAVVSRVPFAHLVSVFQAARRDEAATLAILERTGYEAAVREEGEVIGRELQFVAQWLDHQAPESVKFSIQEELPQLTLSDEQKKFLSELAGSIQNRDQYPSLDTSQSSNEGADEAGQAMHDAIYAVMEAAQLKPAAAFQALYRVLLNRDSGPKAGWFLASLDPAWLDERLRAGASTAAIEPVSAAKAQSVPLTSDHNFSLAPEVARAFPQAVIGYVVADIQVAPKDETISLAFEQLPVALADKGVTLEAIGIRPEIAVWRQAYKAFGVKPSDYRSSVEALTRRVLQGKPPQVNAVVDAYNLVSVRHLVPMGAMDLDQVHGNIVIRYGRAGEAAKLLGVAESVMVAPEHVVYADDDQIITWLWNHRDAAATAVTEATRHAVFFIDSLTGIEVTQEAIAELSVLLVQQGATIKTSGIVKAQGI